MALIFIFRNCSHAKCNMEFVTPGFPLSFFLSSLSSLSLLSSLSFMYIYIYMFIYPYVCMYIYILYIYVDIYKKVYIYIYIYIFTNLISTSIHGTRKKKKTTKKPPPGTRDLKYLESPPGEKIKNYRSKRKKRPTSSDPKEKIKGYAVSWSKEN